MEKKVVIMVEQRVSEYSFKHQQLAFRPEFYEGASHQQIVDDFLSFAGEYRFKVPEYDYKLGIFKDKLIDPNSLEEMTSKAQKAIDLRKEHSLKTTREEAELQGFLLLEEQLKENSTGTVLWFSPPGSRDDGYGDYGFAFLGQRDGDNLEMTAIRLENPTLEDFNAVNKTLSDTSFSNAEDFLRNPKVLDIEKAKVRDFVIGTFELSSAKNKIAFDKAKSKWEREGTLRTFTHIMQNGTAQEKREAINIMENLAIEYKDMYNTSYESNVVFIADHKPVNLYDAMQMKRYIVSPPPIPGSCGMSGKVESSNIFGKLLGSETSTLRNSLTQEWFTCPKCTYKADGPVGNKCPGCGLTKEQYVKDGGENCD